MKRISLSLIPFLLTPGFGLAAGEQAPWHVKEADVRVPVTVDVYEALLRMPPQVYLADLKSLEAKDLAFDPKSKSAVPRDVRPAAEKAGMIAKIKEQCEKTGQEYNPEFYKPDERVKGSATFSLRPEYKWFSFGRPWGNSDHVHVFVDGEEVGSRTVGRVAPYIVALPPGAKTLRIEADTSQMNQAGFITRHPAAARASFCLPGRDPTALIPLVYDLSGKQVGCRILWAHPEEPMSILFDTSSGEDRYLVYLVDHAKKPSRLDWAPEAGLILETRYMDRYDSEVETLQGFLKLWDSVDFVAGKSVPDFSFHWGRTTVCRQGIHHGFLPFRSMAGNTPNYLGTPRGAPLALSRYTGFFHVPETQEYEFIFMVWPAGYFLIDNQTVAELQYKEARERYAGVREWGKGTTPDRFRLKLERGLHRLDFLQYGGGGRFYASLAWGMPGGSAQLFGTRFRVWEPLAEAAAGPAAHRTDALHASFAWRHGRPHRDHPQWLALPPTHDVVLYSFSGKLFPARDGAVFRWRFDDGHAAEGERVDHHFFSPGIRNVELEVLDGPDGNLLARATGAVHVHVDYAGPGGGAPEALEQEIARRAGEFASVTPIEEVVSLYRWSLNNYWTEHRRTLGAALAGRVDALIEKQHYLGLRELAEPLADPSEAQYDAAQRLLEAAMDRIPAGEPSWKSAATILADILVSVRGEPEKGLELLDKVEKAALPAFDTSRGWRTARAKRWRPSAPDGDELAGETRDLDWSEPSYLSFDAMAEGGRGTWVMNDFHIPASRQGKELVLDLRNAADGAMLWFNGRRIPGRQRLCGGEVVIPPDMQLYDQPNRFLALFQPIPPPDFFAGRPQLDFSRGASPPWNSVRIPMEIYTTPSLDEKGVQYTYYEGEWPLQPAEQREKGFPNFDAMEPILEGTLTNLAIAPVTHEWRPPPPFHVTTFDLSPRKRDTLFAMKFTGYIEASAGVHQFTLRCGHGGSSRLWIDSTLAIDNQSPFPERPARGSIYLTEGVHALTAIYLQRAGRLWMTLQMPDQLVPAGQIQARPRIAADALLMMGEEEKARELLRECKPDAPPIDEKTHLKLSSDLRRVYRWAETDRIDAGYALGVLDEWLHKYPMLRLEPDFMAARIQTYSGLGDHERAFTLARQMRRMNMNDDQRRQLMLVQVRSLLKARKIDAARKVYDELRQMAPYSSATIAAREAIAAAVRQGPLSRME